MKPRYDPDRHHRRSIRLSGWDYAGSGVYFVTVCAHERRCLFGDVVDGQMQLTPIGRLVGTVWRRGASERAGVDLDILQVMPNHVHAIILVDLTPAAGAAPSQPSGTIQPGSLGAIVGNLKAVCTRRVNRLRDTPGTPLWQRNYWERIVRDEEELARIRAYIISNPARWAEDRLNASDKGEHIGD